MNQHAADNLSEDGLSSDDGFGFSNPGDRPIESLFEDCLGRRPFAEALADEILGAPLSGGYVMGLTGTWGSGKTSILNMTIEALGDRALVLEFNPWLFSGTEALVASYFAEISKQLDRSGTKFKGIAKRLSSYGRMLSPFAAMIGAGGAVDAVTGLLNQLSSQPSVVDQRIEICEELTKLDRPLVVVLDDVDRLRSEEVLDIVRLVRLVGDFPNTLYLLAFDRPRIEECLGDGDPERGRAYLEKIVQVTYDVPAARVPDVTSLLLKGLTAIVDGIATAPLDKVDWQNIFTFIIRPLVQTPRQVRRYLLSLPMTLRLVGDEVALADMLGLEAIRILRPEMFEAIVKAIDALAPSSLATMMTGYQTGQDAQTSPVAPLVKIDAEFAAAICKWLFPAAQRYFENINYGPEWETTWRLQRKVASPSVFRFYLERTLPSGVVPARIIDEALVVLVDAEELTDLLGRLTTDELVDLLERLPSAIEEIPFDSTQPIDNDPARVALPIFLDLLPRLPKRSANFGEIGGTITVARVAYRLLKRIANREQLTDIVRDILGETTTFSGQLILLFLVGNREGIGTQLLDAEEVRVMEGRLRDLLIVTSAEILAGEMSLVDLAELMVETTEGREALLRLAHDDRLLVSLLVNSCSQAHTQALGAAAVRVTEVLDWGRLVSYLGEEFLIRRVAELMERYHERSLDLSPEQYSAVELASRYATGWHPDTVLERIMRMSRDSEQSRSLVEITDDTEAGKHDSEVNEDNRDV